MENIGIYDKILKNITWGFYMYSAKVSSPILKRSVINLIQRGPRTGIDCSVFPINEDSYILSATAVSMTDNPVGPNLAVIKASNNIWASGGTLLGIESAFLLNTEYKEKDLKVLTRKILSSCELCGTYLAGGHTEVSENIKENCITVTSIGKIDGQATLVNRAEVGMDLIVTKWIGLEEIAMIMANPEKSSELKSRFSQEYLKITLEFLNWIPIQNEAAVAIKHGVRAMHDISEGGIFSALWDLAESAGVGIEVDLRKIPVLQEIIEICSYLDINPYKMRSSGSLLIACENGLDMLEALESEGISASIIGKITDNNKKIIQNDQEIRYLDRN